MSRRPARVDAFCRPADPPARRAAIQEYVRVFGAVSVPEVADLLRVTPERAREDLRAVAGTPGIAVRRGRAVRTDRAA